MSKPELADVVVRDPFVRPVKVLTKDIPLMQAALDVVLQEAPAKESVIISAPASWPMTVIGAKAGPPCFKCKREVWAAPSMQAAIAEGLDANVACMECLERAAGMRP